LLLLAHHASATVNLRPGGLKRWKTAQIPAFSSAPFGDGSSLRNDKTGAKLVEHRQTHLTYAGIAGCVDFCRRLTMPPFVS